MSNKSNFPLQTQRCKRMRDKLPRQAHKKEHQHNRLLRPRKVGNRQDKAFPLMELPSDIRNVLYEFMKPHNISPIPLAYRPSNKRSKRPAFHPYFALTQVNMQLRSEFRPYMKSVTFIIDLESLGLFMKHWDMINEEQIGKIVTGLRGDPLPVDGVEIIPLLQFLWTTTSIKLAYREREGWDPIEVTEILSRNTYMQELIDDGLVTSITMAGGQEQAKLTIKLSDIHYDSKCYHVVLDVIQHITHPRGEKRGFIYKHGLTVVCGTRRVKGLVFDGSLCVSSNGWCKCRK